MFYHALQVFATTLLLLLAEICDRHDIINRHVVSSNFAIFGADSRDELLLHQHFQSSLFGPRDVNAADRNDN